MKHDYFPKSIRFLFVTILILNFSCNKVLDFYPGHSHVKSKCKILHFEIDPGNGFIDSFKIEYDKRGNPTSLINNNKSTGYWDIYFNYDKRGRLIEKIELVQTEPIIYNSWIRYQYNNKNQIVSDSFWGLGYYNGQYPDPNSITQGVSYYEYDELERLSKWTIQFFYGEDTDENPPFVYEYNYDQYGNLIRWGTYDNKTNLNRTHPLWQFLSKDYSMNNLIGATVYNNIGLPTSFGESNAYFVIFALANSRITYDCKK